MPVLLPAEVPSVQYLHPGNLQHEHGSPQHVPSIVTPELYASYLNTQIMDKTLFKKLDKTYFLLLMEVDGLNLVHGSLQITVSVQHLVSGDVADLDIVRE